MPAPSQHASIRAFLQQDPAWAVYALGDLAPGCLEHCEWLTAENRAVLLVYREFSTPILWMSGEPEDLGPLFAQIAPEPALRLQIRPETVPLIETTYRVAECKPMWRMSLAWDDFAPTSTQGARRLTVKDSAAVQELYDDGKSHGEAPDFYFPSMLEFGVFYGMWADGRLAAVAGTHLVAESESVAAIGNVYTRRSHRGRGYASTLTSALCQELRSRQIGTIALSVHRGNQPAVSVYRKLGFRIHCPFFEGLAEAK